MDANSTFAAAVPVAKNDFTRHRWDARSVDPGFTCNRRMTQKESAMQFDAPQAVIPLRTPQPLRLVDARGTWLRAMSGALWVTLDHDSRDLVLQTGESLLIETTAPVTVSALGGRASVGLCAPQRAARAPQRWGGLARLGGRLGALLRPHGHAGLGATA